MRRRGLRLTHQHFCGEFGHGLSMPPSRPISRGPVNRPCRQPCPALAITFYALLLCCARGSKQQSLDLVGSPKQARAVLVVLVLHHILTDDPYFGNVAS